MPQGTPELHPRRSQYTLPRMESPTPAAAAPSAQAGTALFSHLIDPDFTPLDAADVTDLLDAQAGTASMLDFDGNADELDELQKNNVRQAFAVATSPDADPILAKANILALRAPAQVRHLAGMLSQYDWDFVEQAKEIRGYVVAQLLEHSKDPNPKVALRALELTGKLTEVGSFTERVSITRTDGDASAIEDRIRSRLAGLLPKVVEVQEATVIPEPEAFTIQTLKK